MSGPTWGDMGYRIIVFCLTSWTVSFAQPSIERLNNGCLTFAYWQIRKYADSLSLSRSERVAEDFIERIAVDEVSLFGRQCLAPHHRVSFRNAILKRIVSIGVLERFSVSADKRLDELVDWKSMQREAKEAFKRNARERPEADSIPYMQFTLRELVNRRIVELQIMQRSPPESKSCWEWSDYTLNLLADSLNHWVSGKPLPKFLQDRFLDLKLQKQLNQCTVSKELISYRREVVFRVVNREVLEAIARSGDPAIGAVVDAEELSAVSKFSSYPYLRFSMNELARMRLDDINRVTGAR